MTGVRPSRILAETKAQVTPLECGGEPGRTRVSGRAATLVLLMAIVAASASVFGFGFAPTAHQEEEGAEHAEPEGEPAEEEGSTHEEEEDPAEGAGAGEIASSILISLAGMALVPFAPALVQRRRWELGGVDRRLLDVSVSAFEAAAVPLALLSIGAAVVHFAVMAQHFDEWWLTGLFFLSIALFQLIWAVVVLVRTSALLYAVGAVVNALIVVTWIVSRTTGVPVGPEAGEAEPVGFPDALASVFEIVLVAIVLAVLSGVALGRRDALLDWTPAGWAAAAVIASLTALALTTLA